MTTHSKLPPSSAARRMACPGSRAMEERYGRDEKSEASIEGELAHELAALYAKAYNQGGIEFVDYKDGEYTEEMDDCAREYGRIIDTFIDEEDLHIESPVYMNDTIHPEMWGTPDAWGIITAYLGAGISSTILHIFDYKYGFTPVEAYENWQLLAYACGLVVMHYHTTDIYLHIIQPRDYISGNKHKMWHLTAQELMSYKQRLIASEALAMSPNAPLIVSDQCKYCKARYACPALQQAAFGATEVAHRSPIPNLTPKELGTELKFLHDAQELLNYRVTALEAEAEHLLMSGERVDNYELKHTESRLMWNASKEDILFMGQAFGVDLKKEDVLTPTQAIKAGVPEETVLKCAERKSSNKLSRVDLTKSKEMFKK